MRLYTNKKGQWVGTQADAKKAFGEIYEVIVPTDKAALLQYLNDRQVIHGDTPQNVFGNIENNWTHPLNSEPLPVTMKPSSIQKPHAWQTIRECAEKADLKDLGVALAVLMDRLDEAADNVRH